MDKDSILLQPQIVQFGLDQKQLIKVINRTNEAIEDCVFNLYNTDKYQFSPRSFSLLPKQHKLITITLKLKIKDGPAKQFAYLNSKNINKRITLINSSHLQQQSDQKFRSPLSGTEEMNTLSSRDYREQQKMAYDKVITQKEAYIQRLERRLQQQELFIERQKEFASANKTNKFYLDQIHSLELKVDLLSKEKQQLIAENILLQGNFKQYRILMEGDGRTAQMNQKITQCNKELAAQAEEIKYLEHQCQQFLKKISQKETKIRQTEFSYVSKIDSIIKEGEKKLQEMENKIQQERKQSEKMLKQSKKQVQSSKKQIKNLESELNKKQKQLKSLSSKIQVEKKNIREQLSEQKKKSVRLQVEHSKLQKDNKQLQQKIKGLQKSLQQLKQQTIIYKSKIQDQDSSAGKLNQYLQMALQSSKNQNQMLKISKAQIQNALNEQNKIRKQLEAKIHTNEQNLKIATSQIQQLKEQKQNIQSAKIKQQQEMHEKLIKLKSENVQLIQKISSNKRNDMEREEKLQESKDKIKQFEDQIQRYETDLSKAKQNEQYLREKLMQVQDAKQKISKRIQKYRKQAKKQIKSIHDSAKDELKKIQQQKNKLQRKVQQLQVSAQNTEGIPFNQNETRNKTRTQYQAAPYIIPNKYPMSHQGDRKTGIKNQRRELEQSNANSRTEIDMDKIYTELGQLREFKNYVNNQVRKLGSHQLGNSHGSNYDQNINSNPIFSVINFFKDLEHKLSNKLLNTDKLNEAQKQVEFLKGRLTQLEPIAKKLKQKDKQLAESQFQFSKKQNDRSAIQYIREQMKAQYKKLYDSLKISEQKYEILKKKIYEQYRVRLIELISKKDKDQYTINKIQAVLERFVDGLSNTSHKEAILAKEVKLKQQARRQVSVLKNKIVAINKQLEKDSKKKNCIRDPVKVFDVQNENQWLDYIKLQAKTLTFQAENARLNQQISLLNNKFLQMQQQLKLCEADLEAKQESIERLKKEVITVSTQSQNQISKQEEEINTFKKKFVAMQKMEKQLADFAIKDKQNAHLRSQIQEKRDTIKQLRERLRQLEQLLDESKRNQSVIRDKQRKEYMDQSRMQQSLRDLRENNRQLRNQNQKLKQQIDSLVEDANKKNAALKRLKSESQQYRIKNVKSEQNSLQKLKSQVRQLKDEIRKCKQDADRLKRKKEREINEKQSQIDKCSNQFAIERSSLESIIRALIDTISGIYCSLDIIARKKGKIVSQSPNFEDLIKNPSNIKSTKIRQFFEQVIEALKQ